MKPLSAAEFAASGMGTLPSGEQVSDGVWTVPLDVPDGHVPYSFSYLVLDVRGGVHVIDPGWESERNWELVESALAGVGKSTVDVASVTVTHLHPDHLGLAERLRAESGAPVALHRLEQAAIDRLTRGRVARPAVIAAEIDEWGVPAERYEEILDLASRVGELPAFTADILLEHGQLLEIPGRSVRAVLTPGHTAGHICIQDADAGLLFTGDHVLPTVYPGLGLGGSTATNPIDVYLESLRRVASFDDNQVCPGHGYRFTGLAARCAVIERHHLRRSAEVADILRRFGQPSVWEVASRVTWSAGWENLRSFTLYSALAQTAMHIDFVRGARAAA